MSEEGSWERVEALMIYHFDAIADCEEYRADLAMVKEHAAQVAALTAERDALLAACRAAKKWHEEEIEFGLLRPSVLDSVREQIGQLAAAIAMREAKG